MRWILLGLAIGCSTNGTLTDGGGEEVGKAADRPWAESAGPEPEAPEASADGANEAILPPNGPADAGPETPVVDAPKEAAPEKPADVRPESSCPTGADDGGCRQWCLCNAAACGGTVVPYCGERCDASC